MFATSSGMDVSMWNRESVPAQKLLDFDISHCGFLKRRKNFMGFKTWSRCYNIIYKGALYIYSNEDSRKPDFSCSFIAYGKVERTAFNDKWAFSLIPLVSSLPVIVLAAASKHEMVRWMAEIRLALLQVHGRPTESLLCQLDRMKAGSVFSLNCSDFEGSIYSEVEEKENAAQRVEDMRPKSFIENEPVYLDITDMSCKKSESDSDVKCAQSAPSEMSRKDSVTADVPLRRGPNDRWSTVVYEIGQKQSTITDSSADMEEDWDDNEEWDELEEEKTEQITDQFDEVTRRNSVNYYESAMLYNSDFEVAKNMLKSRIGNGVFLVLVLAGQYILAVKTEESIHMYVIESNSKGTNVYIRNSGKEFVTLPQLLYHYHGESLPLRELRLEVPYLMAKIAETSL